jgi:type VI secretion system protein ImpJ
MKLLSPPVWHEGMHLAQHHFQTQNRYVEDLTAFVAAQLLFRPYGLAGWGVDEDALTNDLVSVRHARGVMPDGLVFDFPGDPPPEPLEIRSLFSPTQESHVVLLAIPALRAGHPNLVANGDGEDGSRRYRPRGRAVADEVLGGDERELVFAEKNFRLILDTEDDTGLTTLPVARVRRDGSGRFVFDADYIPPTIQVAASPSLISILGRLIEMIGARTDGLAVEATDAPGELVSHLLANALNSAMGPLTHHYHARRAHPEQVYVELLRLAGALCTFSMTADPRGLPMYDHDHPGQCFGALERTLRELLGVVLPAGAVRIHLRQAGDSFFHGTVDDRRCLTSSRWFLGIGSSDSRAEITAKVPRLVKVCSAKFIERLVREAFPGLPLEPAPSPPAEISPKPDRTYFAIPQTGPCWTSIVETGEVGIYAPAAIANLELELVIATE